MRDTLQEAAEYLEEHPHVSGVAAKRYRNAVHQYQERFAGISLTNKQASALLSNPELWVYDGPGQIVACCFDASKALCRRDNPKDVTARTPDLTACDKRCPNIARTDKHIEELQRQVNELEMELGSPVTPEPIRDRIAKQIVQREAIIRAHDETSVNEHK